MMTVFVLTACPEGLRGHLTRWMLEIAPGVFVGTINTRIRDFLWEQVKQYSQKGRALMVYSANTEQGLAFETWYHDWSPTDHDGMILIRRREQRALEETFIRAGLISRAEVGNSQDLEQETRPQGTGLSKASQRRRYRKR